MNFDKYEKNGAYHFSWYSDPNWAWYKECVDRCVEFCKGSTLDVGGGDGLLASKIIERGHLATVVDNDNSALAICDKKLIPNIWANLESPNMIYYTFDYMACLNVIEHLETPESIKEIFNDYITKGAIIITDKPTGNVGRYHEHEYTKKELLEIFKDFKPKYFEIKSTEHGKPITFHGVEIRK